MGTITLIGAIQGQQFTGQIWFQNLWSFASDGSELAGASGMLGTFSMPACSVSGGLFQCVQ
jgi:hypothetical protein